MILIVNCSMCLLILALLQALRHTTAMSLKALAQHLCVSYKDDKPTAVLTSVQAVLVEVAGALKMM